MIEVVLLTNIFEKRQEFGCCNVYLKLHCIMQFDNPSLRLNTFSKWPMGTRVWPQQLSNAGFYFTGNGACVQCFSCGVCTSVDDWDTRDFPEKVHVKLNSACEFMKRHFPHIIDKIEKEEQDKQKCNIHNGSNENTADNESICQENEKALEMLVQNTNSVLSPTTGSMQINDGSGGRNNANLADCAQIYCGLVGVSATRTLQASTETSDGEIPFCTSSSITRNNQNSASNTVGNLASALDVPRALVHLNGAVNDQDVNNQLCEVDHPTAGLVKTSQEPDFAFPNFKQYDRRQASFERWPHTARQSLNLLAMCGFFYTGADDIVRCFCCNLGLSEWNETDDPWIEHARHNPKCWFLSQQKGEDFINHIQEDWKRRYKPMNPAFDDFATRLSTFDGWRDVQQTPEMLSDAGFFFTGEDDTVRCHYCDGGLRNWKDGDIPWEEHARWFPGCKFLIKMKGIAYIDNIKSKYQDQRQTASVKNGHIDESELSKLRSTNHDLKTNLLCVLCKKNESCMLFTNCGHRVTCEQCCSSIVVCPHCNKRIKKTIKTFLS